MKWRKLNRTLHRDLGYFFVGLTLVYAISGIALNHLHHWNPDYKTENFRGSFSKSYDFTQNKDAAAKELIKKAGINYDVKNVMSHRGGRYKIFLDVGSGNTGKIIIDPEEKTYDGSVMTKRPLLLEFNLMHRNNFKEVWTWVSDIYALGLIILAITGLIILRGKYGFKRYGVWLVAAGIVIPLVIVLFYL